MLVQEPPAKVTERIHQLGEKQSCIYLIQGMNPDSGEPSYCLLGGGMVTTGPEVERQVLELGLSPERITRYVIQHSHFDHCGAVPYLKKQWPWLELVASQRSGELLQKDKVVEAVQSMNEVLLQRQGKEDLSREPGFCFEGLHVDRPLAEGDRVECGDLALEVMEAPGHSSCSIVLYEPWQQALFTSDSAGIPMGDDVFTAEWAVLESGQHRPDVAVWGVVRAVDSGLGGFKRREITVDSVPRPRFAERSVK